MKNINWLYVLDVVLMFGATYLLIKRINTYFTTGEIDYLRITINALFFVYITYKVVQHKRLPKN